MPRVKYVQLAFAGRSEAEACMETLRGSAWPYVWCVEDLVNHCWIVTALVERSSVIPLPDRA